MSVTSFLKGGKVSLKNNNKETISDVINVSPTSQDQKMKNQLCP